MKNIWIYKCLYFIDNEVNNLVKVFNSRERAVKYLENDFEKYKNYIRNVLKFEIIDETFYVDDTKAYYSVDDGEDCVTAMITEDVIIN